MRTIVAGALRQRRLVSPTGKSYYSSSDHKAAKWKNFPLMAPPQGHVTFVGTGWGGSAGSIVNPLVLSQKLEESRFCKPLIIYTRRSISTK